MAKMRQIAEEEELKPCTFQPNLEKKYKGITSILTLLGKLPVPKKNLVSKLYEESMKWNEKRKNAVIPIEIQEFEKVKDACVFIPETLQSEYYKLNYF